MTMATTTEYRQDSRNKGAVLCKQSEIEETDEHEPDTSPGSDQSDATITAEEKEHQSGKEAGDLKSSKNHNHEQCRAEVRINDVVGPASPTNHVQVPQKVKQLQRSKAFEESPPPEQHTLIPQANGLGQKSLSHDRLSKCGSQSSEAGSSCFSRDSSFDKSPYKDSTGINLEDFIHKTINKSPKDRTMLLKLETDLINFVNEPKHHYLKFPPMSSYDRMLVHRIAAFFGLDHNVDQTGKSVIVNKTSNKRIPDFSFSEHIDNLEMGDRKLAPIKVMKRGGLSLDDKESYCKTLEKPMLANTKARSFEERKKQYDKVRSKIFNSCDEPMAYSEEEATSIMPSIIKKPQRPSSLSKNSDGPPWSSTDSSGYGTDCSSKSRGIPKANSFGGVPHNQVKAPLKSQSLCKTDSVSSGTQSPNVAHVIAAPTPPGSRSDSSPLSRSSSTGPMQSPLNQVTGYPPGQGQQVFWVASDYRNIPPGSVIINPQTGQPFTNPDGSIYTYNPNQPPPVTQQQPTMYAPPQPPTPQEMWTANQDLSSGTEHVCRHMAAMNLSQQSSLDSVGEPPGLMQTQQYIIQGQPQGYNPNAMGQPQFFPSQNIAGQPNVRYVYPVNYQVAGQGQGSQVPVAADNQNQTIAQNIGQPFVTQYGPSCSGVPMPSAQNVDTYPTFSSQSTYSIPQSDNLQNFQSSYPLPFSQSNFVQNPSQVFYSSVPCSQTVAGYSYGTNQGPYQTGTTPPSQQPPQPQSANISVQTLPGQQVNMVPAVQTPSAPQFTSLYPTMQQPCQGQPQFRQSNPAVLQIPGVQQQHNLNLNPVGVSQTFPPVIRNMQISVPMAGQAPQGFVPQSGQVTVSAKGVPLDNQMPKIESGGDNKDYVLGGIGSFNAPVVAGPSRPMTQILRPPTQITPDLRIIGQPSIRAPIQHIQLHPTALGQPQKPRIVNNIPKTQQLCKSHSKEGSESSSQSIEGESPSQGDTLEVYDLPSTMERSEAEIVLCDLVNMGAQIHFISSDPHTTADSPVSTFRKILAVFPTVNCASQVYQQYSNNSPSSSLFKLRYPHDSS